jgi:signal transduction histidine kinase/ligand-binding sensor domain-containing protein
MPQFRLAVRGTLALLTSAVLLGSPARAGAQRPAVRTFGSAHGLASESVFTLAFDSHGFLWAGTRSGISRFDGTEFVNYGPDDGLPPYFVNDILQDRVGRLWIATNRGGVARFDPEATDVTQAGKPRRFHVIAVGTTPATNRVNQLLEDAAGRLWAGTDAGLFRADDPARPHFAAIPLRMPGETESWTPLIGRLAEGGRGSVWLGTSRGLFAWLPDGTVVSYAGAGTRREGQTHGLIVDRRGFVWAGTPAGLFVVSPEGVSQDEPQVLVRHLSLLRSPSCRSAGPAARSMLPAPGQACRVTFPDGAAEHDVRSVLERRDGRVLAATVRGDIAEFGADAPPHWILVQRNERPAVTIMREDRVGNLWTVDQSRGITRIARSGLLAYDTPADLGSELFGYILGEFDNAIWFSATGGVVYRLEPGRFLRVPLPRLSRVPPPWRSALLDRRGTIWLGTGEGLFGFRSRNTTPRSDSFDRLVLTSRDGLSADAVGRLFEDSRGDVWIATGAGGDSGLARWEGATGRIHRYSTRVHGGQFSQITAFAEDKTGRIWMAFREGGLARLNGDVLEAVDGTAKTVATYLYVDRNGRVWATSFDGAVRFDDPVAERPDAIRLTTRDGLSSNQVSCFAEDRLGRIYIGTAVGVDRLDRATGAIRHFGTTDGLPPGAVFDVRATRDGTIWVTTPLGIASFAGGPDAASDQPAVRIGGMTVAGVRRPIQASGTEAGGTFRFGASENRFQFDFFGLAADLVEPLRYQYRLLGLESDWTTPTRERSITYANLAAGSYRFEVRALTADRSSVSPAFVSFEVLPPLWQRWWVIATAASLIVCAAYAGHRYRLSHILRLERIRQRLATDLHDDIGASLSQIAILSDLGRTGLEVRDLDGVSHRLAAIATTARELVDTMSDIVWAVNPRRDSVEDLVHRMRRFATDTLEAANISVIFVSPPGGAALRLGPNLRREILLIVKEGVTNIVRHANCTDASIDLGIGHHKLTLQIRDNGRGFDPTCATAGNGLRSMRRRAEALGGYLQLESSPGPNGGTTISIQVPIQ